MTENEYQEILELINKLEKRISSLQGEELQDAIETMESAQLLLEGHIAAQKEMAKNTVVFLPYKASMWNSLEGEWKKAQTDENCNVLVVPIPYYDKTPSGNIKEWHWEGNEFPDNVIITDYRSVDLEKLHPDKIYIHNPYDERNLFTSVAPDYYSTKLKNQTNELVYIPYFVLNEREINSKSVEGFAALPGVVYAHTVIVQSEAVRQAYIDNLAENFGEHTRNIWEYKIKGWGSSKLDKASTLSKENFNMPLDWSNKLKKLDGSCKKVIMYGTGFSEMLKSGEKLIDKIESVLQFFKLKQDDVVLLWRPHPLIMESMETIDKSAAERYSNVVNRFKQENWGIYDDTADLHRSIAVSDAYYGDHSSLIQLFQAAKKPVMLENLNVL